MVRVGLSRRSTLKAGSLLLDRYGRHLRGASWDPSLNKMGFGAVPLTARFGESRGEQTKRAKVIVSCEVLSLVGVSGFALTRLQNLVSGVWLKRRVSVAAEASGRGLVVGGSNCQLRKDGRKTNRELAPAGETPVEGLAKGSRRAPYQRKASRTVLAVAFTRYGGEAVSVARVKPA